MGADRGSAFGRGCDGDDGVLVPRTVRLAIGEAAPQMDDWPTTGVDAARRADLAGAPFEVRPEDIGYLPPAILDMSLHYDVSLHYCSACRVHRIPPLC